ncbi:PREDICTED: ribonuclease pancreatic-like [Condylura cristata]|uniref:ribonuclease pancreatic-like n=1 Tax=Condylura cristata TaxID=143302 RepID=UPI00033452F0|nr:PREDICTED: ribonuclease pancreatic-like [Condylura cristata]
MALKTLVLSSLLALGLLVIVGTQPPAAQRFQQRHLDSRSGPLPSNYCNKIMKQRKLLKRNFNTFVHESLEAVQAVCHERTFCCSNGQNNCHMSRHRMNITYCNLSGRNPPKYQTINRMKYIIIACDRNQTWPVYFDGSM